MAGHDVAADPAAARARCAELRAAKAALEELPAADIAAALGRACARWRNPADPDREAAEAALGERYGVPRGSIATLLDAAFERWDGPALEEWIAGELGSVEALDRPVAIGGGPRSRRLALGPELVVALCAHGVPTTPLTDMLAALLVKSPVWIKPASGSDDLAARFARTLAAEDPALGAAVEVSGWPPGSGVGEAVLSEAGAVVATGREETVAALRRAAPRGARLLVHGPRFSVAVVAREALAEGAGRVVAALADDVAFAGQMGCLSPVAAWIEAPAAEIAALVEPLHAACVERWPAAARAGASLAERARFGEWLALAGVERAAGAAGAIAGGFDSGWSVQARARPEPPTPPPVPRLLVLAPLADAREAAQLCARRRGLIATVGLAASPVRAEVLAPDLARAGVERVAPLGAMQRPPPGWRRDGRATLADLVRWFDWES